MDRFIIQSLPKTKRVRLQTGENVDALYKYLDKNYFIYLYLDNFFLSKHNTDHDIEELEFLRGSVAQL
jgi:hypothetical protein